MIKRIRASRSLLDFILYTKADYDPNWHHGLICKELEEFMADERRTRLVVQVGPRRGKLVADSTPVLTLNGWKTHGELAIGDYVFNHLGKPVKVIALSPKMEADTVVQTTSGEAFLVHEKHEWFLRKKDKLQVFETMKIFAESLLGGALKFDRIQPLQFPHKEVTFEIPSWNKIPDEVLYNSEQIRRELLGRYLDSHGTIENNGSCSLSIFKEQVAADLIFALQSLGIRPSAETLKDASGRKFLYIKFFLSDKVPTKRLDLNRCKFVAQPRYAISNIDRTVKKELGRCIQVETLDGIYLIGRTLVPTRNSEIISRRFPAYLFGKFPHLKIIATAYSDSLATALNLDVQRIMDSPEYLSVFPETTLMGRNAKIRGRTNDVRKSDEFTIVGKGGSYKSAGVGVGIGGLGADLVIIDDPYKDWIEANSPNRRETVLNWYKSVVLNRLSPTGKVIIVTTRWHEDDLVGALLNEAESDPEAEQFEVISLPEIQDEHNKYPHHLDPRKHGELLWPSRYNAAWVKARMKTMGSIMWSALFQQAPSVSSGAIFKSKHFKYFKYLPKIDYYALSVDCTFKDLETSDYVVGTVWAVSGANKYLVYIFRDKLDFTATIKEILRVHKLYPLRFTLVEDKANGTAVISVLKKKIAGFIPFPATGSKPSRAVAASPQFESGNVFFPDPNYANNRTEFKSVVDILDVIEKELKEFPKGKKDDIVDSIVQFCLHTAESAEEIDDFLKALETHAAKSETEVQKLADIMGWNLKEYDDYNFGAEHEKDNDEEPNFDIE